MEKIININNYKDKKREEYEDEIEKKVLEEFDYVASDMVHLLRILNVKRLYIDLEKGTAYFDHIPEGD